MEKKDISPHQNLWCGNIYNFTLEELKKEISGICEPQYRARQIFSWLYKKGACSFNEMDNLPKRFIDKLNQNFYMAGLELSCHLKSSDKTEKFLFKLKDGNYIETVLIYAKNRKTVCLSTQVGCRFACSFCASGLMGFIRDLAPSEIIGQILFLRNNFKHRINNYVFMGMGEPMDNYENVAKAILIMNDPEGLDIGARRITISTCGIVPGIEKFKDLGLQVNLSLSLHAANNKLRDKLLPVNRRYPIEKVIRACRDYIAKSGRIITLEYVLIDGVNDSLKDADELSIIAKRLNAKINLIPCSGNPKLKQEPPQKRDIKIFSERLVKNGAKVTLRESKGEDIRAACGQLAGREKDEI